MTEIKMTEQDIQEVHSGLKELRAEVSKTHQDLGKIEKLNEILDIQEAKNQELVKDLAERKNAEEALEAKFKDLEAEVSRPNLAAEAIEEKAAEIKTFEKFLKEDKSALEAEEVKYLRTDNNENGGYLAPSEFANEIIKKITEISPVRSVARVITTSSKEIEIPKRDTLVSGGWVGEGASASSSNSTYGIEKLPVNKMMVYTDVTFEMLKDGAFNIESEIVSDIAEDFAQLEGAAFINGDSVSKPEGLLTNASVGEYNSGAASAITADSLMEIQGELKTGYDMSFMLNRKTLHQHIRTLKGTSNDHFLFQPALNGGVANTIAGVPYVLANDMPDVAANAFPVLLGDFRRAYYIADSVVVETVRDGLTQATSGQVRFVFYKRVGGQVVLPEAVKKLKIAV